MSQRRRYSERPLLLGCLPAPIAKPLNLLDLVGFMQKPRSPNRLRGVVGLSGDLSKPEKNEAWCRWRCKLGAADSGEKSRPRKRLTRSGTCRGTRGSG